jgi:hypothetical protein
MGRISLGKFEEAVRGQPEHPEQSCLFLERDTQNVIAATAAQANLTALILPNAVVRSGRFCRFGERLPAFATREDLAPRGRIRGDWPSQRERKQCGIRHNAVHII